MSALKLAARPATLESLSAAWLDAKRQEQEANARRVDIEQQIAAKLPPAETEQSVAQLVGDYRVTVKYGVTRKVDTEALQELWQELTPQAQQCFKWKADVTLPKLRALKDMLPQVYAKLAPIIETKPSKPSVSIEPTKASA